MKRTGCLLVLLFQLLTGFTQQQHFLYIQADNQQAFYARINEQLYSSSATGYVIIPKLEAGNHTLKIGFPKNEWPIQSWELAVGKEDKGFHLKMINHAWSLVDFHHYTVLPAMHSDAVAQSTGSFASTLATVTGNPDINQASVSNFPKADSMVAANNIVQTSENPDKRIVKIDGFSSEGNFISRYAVPNPGSLDTVDVTIENIEKVVELNLKEKEQLPKAAVLISNNSCKRLVTKKMLFNLQNQLSQETTFEAKLEKVKKSISSYCVSTTQVRLLAAYFPTDEARYYFMDAVYPRTADQHEFVILRDLLNEDHYKRRFEAMIQP